MTVQDDLQIVAEWVALSSSMIASGESLSEISVGTRQRVFAALARLESRLEQAERLAEAVRDIAIPEAGGYYGDLPGTAQTFREIAAAALAEWDGDSDAG